MNLLDIIMLETTDQVYLFIKRLRQNAVLIIPVPYLLAM